MADEEKIEDGQEEPPEKKADHKHDEIDAKVDNITGGHEEEAKLKKLDLSQFSPKARGRFEDIKGKLEGQLKHLGSSDLKSRDEVINHVGEALQDIADLEAKPRLNSRQVDDQLISLVNEIDSTHNDIVYHKNLNIDKLYKYIGNFVDLVGPNRDTTSLFLSIDYDNKSYLTKHTMNVILLTISLAVELTKIMEKKITNDAVCNDLKKVLICNRKIFTRKQIIEIGVSAFLHDLNLGKVFPQLNPESKFGLKEQSAVEKHAAEGYHFLRSTFPALDFEIMKAVYQHHEYMDGSGAPNGVQGRFFSLYSPIVSFAVHFIMHTTENPFNNMKHPFITLQTMMTKQREKFDDDVLLAYVHGAGFYPLGSWVLLNSGYIGVVVKNNRDALKTPVVRCALNAKFEQIESQDIDTKEGQIKIHAPVPYNEVKKRVTNYKEILLQGNTPESPFAQA